MQIKTTMSYHHLEWPSPKSIQTANVGKDVEKGEPLYTVDLDVNWSSRYGEQDEGSFKNWPSSLGNTIAQSLLPLHKHRFATQVHISSEKEPYRAILWWKNNTQVSA